MQTVKSKTAESEKAEKKQDLLKQNNMEHIMKSTAKILSSRVGQQIIRGILGTIFKKKK